MGREIRMVPPNWEHPRYTKETSRRSGDVGEYMSMHDETFEDAAREWKESYAQWEAGTSESAARWKKNEPDMQYWEYCAPPDREFYRPAFTEEPTWFQVYQTVSEGTPVTPPFPTKEALVEYLMIAGDFWDQKRGRGGYTRAQAEAFVNVESVCSMIVSNGVVYEGIESAALIKTGTDSARVQAE